MSGELGREARKADMPAQAAHPTAFRGLMNWLLDHESKLLGAILSLLAADQWWMLVVRIDEYWIYLENGIYSSPLLSLLVTALSAVYMSITAVILLSARKPLARYETLLPNLCAVAGGFGLYVFGLIEPAETKILGLHTPLILLVVGTAIVLWALWYLRRAFSVVPQARTVVQNGPYRYIRHPMYVGNMLTIAGLGLFVSTPSALFLSLICVALQICRAHYEDRLLMSTFADYGGYMSRVNAFIPRLSGRGIVRLAVIVAATIIAECATDGSALAVKAGAQMAAKCQAWHKKALAGQWFSLQEADEYNDTDSDEEKLESVPACKDFFALADSCGGPVEEVMAEDPGPRSRPSQAYVKATDKLLKVVEEVPGCKSIAGFENVCQAIRVHARSGKTLSPKLQSILQECADESVGRRTTGLIRAGQ